MPSSERTSAVTRLRGVCDEAACELSHVPPPREGVCMIRSPLWEMGHGSFPISGTRQEHLDFLLVLQILSEL